MCNQTKTIGLQCLHTIPRRVTFLHDDRMNINTQKNVFRDLDGISTSETWFLKKYIDDEIKKKVDNTRDQLASDEMAYDIRQYIHCLQHDPFGVGRIKNDINKLLVNREYIEFFIQSYNFKEGVFCILQTIRIHTGLRKWSKKDRFHIFLRDKNPLGIK